MHITHDRVVETPYQATKAGLDFRFYVLFSAIILISALAFRLIQLQSRSLWIDETYSYWFTTRSLANLWHVVPLYETHPPLYYTLLKGWIQVFNASESGMRSLSVVFSLVSIAILLGSARLAKLGRNAEIVTLVAAWLLAINTGNIEYAQQARPYAMEALAALIAVISALFVLFDLQSKAWRTDKSLRVMPLCFFSAGCRLDAVVTQYRTAGCLRHMGGFGYGRVKRGTPKSTRRWHTVIAFAWRDIDLVAVYSYVPRTKQRRHQRILGNVQTL